ncbi:zinc finger, CCHC-type containing protein [Tanacetum coccineum]
MKDNQDWCVVDLPPNGKSVRSKWIFKKNTNMDGKIYIYKAYLVTKGFTQTYGVHYEETFPPVVYIRAIRILIAISVFYDYEIWKMDVKTVFLNGYLDEDINMVQPKDNSKRRNIPMQERLDLDKTQGASTPEELKRMKNDPYDSVDPLYMFLVYGENPEDELRVDYYCDVGFKIDRDDIKSQTGYVFILNGGAVDWKSSKQSTTVMSAIEVEYIAASEAAMEVVWIRKFILGLGIVPTINKPIKMLCDNSAALLITNELGVQRGARHYHRRYHYVQTCIELCEINLLKVHTDNNLADPFTKALPKGKLTKHARSMGLCLASSFI